MSHTPPPASTPSLEERTKLLDRDWLGSRVNYIFDRKPNDGFQVADDLIPRIRAALSPAAGRAAVVEECARVVALRAASKLVFGNADFQVPADQYDDTFLVRYGLIVREFERALAPASPTGGQASSPVVTEAGPVSGELIEAAARGLARLRARQNHDTWHPHEPLAPERMKRIEDNAWPYHRAEARAALEAALPARAAEQAGGWQRVTDDMVETFQTTLYRSTGFVAPREFVRLAMEAALLPAPPRAAEQPTPAVDGGRA